MSRAYVYILECSDGTYYTGSTKDLWQRLKKQQVGKAANYTRRRRPVVLVYYEIFERIDEAFEREKQIQG
jgi:putative endonuclease